MFISQKRPFWICFSFLEKNAVLKKEKDCQMGLVKDSGNH